MLPTLSERGCNDIVSFQPLAIDIMVLATNWNLVKIVSRGVLQLGLSVRAPAPMPFSIILR